MSEQRFQKTRIVDKWGGIYDSKTDEVLDVNDVEHKLNEQQLIIEAKDSLLSVLSKENEQLRQQLKEKQEDEKEYAREILRLNKLVKEYSEIRQLGGDY